MTTDPHHVARPIRGCATHEQYREVVARIEAATTAAFKLGFEHAVAGGDDAASKVPQLAGKMPLILFFNNEADRRQMIAAVESEKPGMIEVKVPR